MADLEKLNKNLFNKVIKIKKECETYLWYVENLSHDFSSTLKLRDIIENSKRLEKYYNQLMEEYYNKDGDKNA